MFVRLFSVVLGSYLTSHVIVGTPKEIVTYRILGLFDVKKIQMAVFDDGDVVATSHLVIDHVVRHLQPSCQKILFSATLNNASVKHFERPVVMRLLRENELQENVHQTYAVCANLAEKLDVIYGIFAEAMSKRLDDAGKFIVFCSVRKFVRIIKWNLYNRKHCFFFFQKRETAKWLSNKMKSRGAAVSVMTGELTIDERCREMNRFNMKFTRIMIATDIISRGVDLPDVKIVVNFDFATNAGGQIDSKKYLHRIGRTGRLGKFHQQIVFSLI